MGIDRMKPQLISLVFGPENYRRLANVLRHTTRLYCDDWDVRIEEIAPATVDPRNGQPLVSALGKQSHLANTQKMLAWYEAVATAPEGARLLLIDCDAMITRPLTDIWDQSFDIAYTAKRHTKFPFNSGVVFVRKNARTEAFFLRWRDENLDMLRDKVHHQEWRQHYGGINQAALGRALEAGWTDGLALLEVPCAEWNCEDSHWRTFDPAVTRIVHIKSALRMAVLGTGPVLDHVRPLADLWRQMERRKRPAA